MNLPKMLMVSSFLIAATSLGVLSGCAHYEVNNGRGNIPGRYIRYEMQEADRAVEAARQAGKDKTCSDEFKAAEAAKNKAYDVFRACHTEEGAALAKEATAKANALCPPQAAKEEPAPVIPAPAPAPAQAAPSGTLTITPDSVVKGQAATLAWTSKNAEKCTIQPDVGPVAPKGSQEITPADTTTYTLACNGEGGAAESSARVAVTAPVPAPAKEPVKLCSPTVINIKFDTGRADIKSQYHEELKKLADFLKEFPEAKGVIEGYTDNVGAKEMNMKLSQRRADSVRNYLIKHFGIASERLGAKGFGPNKPVADNKTAAGKQQNRRIESNFTCDGK
jgi:OOP family OmpA-OmpF porin